MVTDSETRAARSGDVRVLALAALLALVGCDRGPFVPATHRDGDRVVLPLTFPDGTRATIAYPPELGIAELGVRPYGSATLHGKGRDFFIRHGLGGRSHQPNALRLELGRWTVEVWDPEPGSPGALTAAERRTFRTRLRGRATDGGFLVLDASPPLVLAKAGEHAGPALEFGYTRDAPWLRLALVRCGPKAESTGPGFASWCLSDGIVAHAYGGRRFLTAAAEGIELR